MRQEARGLCGFPMRKLASLTCSEFTPNSLSKYSSGEVCVPSVEGMSEGMICEGEIVEIQYLSLNSPLQMWLNEQTSNQNDRKI